MCGINTAFSGGSATVVVARETSNHCHFDSAKLTTTPTDFSAFQVIAMPLIEELMRHGPRLAQVGFRL